MRAVAGPADDASALGGPVGPGLIGPVEDDLDRVVESVGAECRHGIAVRGDVRGELQFTYISLDDFRIVRDALKGKGRSTENRGAVPYAVFLTPPFARVGLSEEEAVAAGKQFKKTLLPTAAIPKAQVLRETRGALKVLVEEGTGLILGAHLFCPESPEMINLVKRAMDSKIPASELAEQIYTHPTMTELRHRY